MMIAGRHLQGAGCGHVQALPTASGLPVMILKGTYILSLRTEMKLLSAAQNNGSRSSSSGVQLPTEQGS